MVVKHFHKREITCVQPRQHSLRSIIVRCLLATGLAAGNVYGQGPGPFLRVGPFDFDAQTSLDAIYTTNVEQERKSEATADRQDWYLVWSLDLKSTASMMPNTQVTLDTGIAIEKHFNRPDLDNSENPFGRIKLEFATDIEPLLLNAGLLYESTSDSVDEKFIPKGLGYSTKKRQTGTTLEYLAGAQWVGEKLRLATSYDYTEERYDSEEFSGEEQDERVISYEAGLKLVTIRGVGVGATYSIEYTDTLFINTQERTDETTENISLDFDTLELWDRPSLTYSIGVEKETTDDDEGEWELTHTVTVSDDYDITPVLNLKGMITYDREDTPEEDDIELTFDVIMTHELSRRTQQTFSASRKPVDTFGSNLDTDETTFDYGLTVQDFLLTGVGMSFSIGYTIDRPVDAEEEKTTDVAAGLDHTVPINARLSRSIRYEYTLEDSNLENELLEEHRVTLSFAYQL